MRVICRVATFHTYRMYFGHKFRNGKPGRESGRKVFQDSPCPDRQPLHDSTWLASFWQTEGSSSSKNVLHQFLLSTSLASNRIWEDESTGVLGIKFASWLHIFLRGMGIDFRFKYFYFCFAMRALFNRRINSSVLPENIDPQITSMWPRWGSPAFKFSKNMK